MHPASLPAEELLSGCSAQAGRRGGPGGQHRNKVETAIVLLHRETGVSAEASERRSQADNRRVALRRLRLRLALEVRRAVDPGAPPSRIWRQRSQGGRLSVSAEHEDFAGLLAELLDRLAAMDYHLPEAAAVLGISSSQAIKLLKQHPPALVQVNDLRQTRGQHRLK